ncbi:MAG: hypothetical protein AB7V08_14350 [Elusimicrobiales bacterium]
MEFTPLETTAVTGFVSVLVALVVHVLTKRNYVSHGQCLERHANICATVQSAQDSTRTLFRMVRALVVHDKGMPADVKADILNETPGGK